MKNFVEGLTVGRKDAGFTAVPQDKRTVAARGGATSLDSRSQYAVARRKSDRISDSGSDTTVMDIVFPIWARNAGNGRPSEETGSGKGQRDARSDEDSRKLLAGEGGAQPPQQRPPAPPSPDDREPERRLSTDRVAVVLPGEIRR